MMSNESPPDDGSLYQAALGYLGRYAATEAGLRRVLRRRIERWVRGQADREAVEGVVAAAEEAVEAVVRRLVAAGALSDEAYAESRVRSLTRGGVSQRSVRMRLIAKGVAPELARTAASVDGETELAAALVLARKRRIGPFRADAAVDEAVRLREAAVMARGGFSHEVARSALEMAPEEAEARIFELRR